MKDRLCVISTKNPTNVLLQTIQNVKDLYPEFDIVIIDSDSNNKSNFSLVPPDCIIDFCKNKNWELGAWKYAFNKYNDYKVYMFIQDTLIPTKRVPDLDSNLYINGTIYTCNYRARISDGGFFYNLINVYKDSNLQFISEFSPDFQIIGAAHSSFITNKDNVNIILQLENVYEKKQIVKCKIDSWLAERTIGIMADRSVNRIDMGYCFNKINGNRDY